MSEVLFGHKEIAERDNKGADITPKGDVTWRNSFARLRHLEKKETAKLLIAKGADGDGKSCQATYTTRCRKLGNTVLGGKTRIESSKPTPSTT